MDEEWAIQSMMPEHPGDSFRGNIKPAFRFTCIYSKITLTSHEKLETQKEPEKNITLDKCNFEVGKGFVNLTPKVEA